MPTGNVFMAVSLDGFVAREDFGLDWLMKKRTQGEDHGYDEFMESVDGLVIGSGSFRTTLTFGAWPYEKPVFVLSSTLKDSGVPAELRDKVSITGQSPLQVMASLPEKGWKRAYIDGGKVIQSFLREGLIDDMTVTIVPILIGAGKRMFGALDGDVDLQLLATKQFPSGLLSMKYKIP
jgi:dihydrofolate reductase